MENMQHRIGELEAALTRAEAEHDRLEQALASATEALLHAELAGDVEEAVLEAILDHRRGLISTDELYERTVGR